MRNKKGFLIFILALGVSAHTLAATVESCPSPAQIKRTVSVYSARTGDNEGEWLGIAPAGSGGNIRQFNAATFYPAQDDDISRGSLAKCSYEVDKGTVDLRYKPNSLPEPVVALEGSTVWHRKEGPFGVIYYECTDPTASGCKFTIVR
ncbi:DUF3757 domain-containing protein [Paraburkholderia sp. LEh10]|uniref:DUF3757 domain-containing protein n=1 Tax=Paraburkholderia sp. LEh10 TaxID=2821353 RepID=UPI001AE882B9|nr:DUF3757 domain-containing protein [Paraburkholderia sp. LEh10]MBP0596328.1 DUF3757 domain-containing protein [Paraburkholderia sp. LEh10]